MPVINKAPKKPRQPRKQTDMRALRAKCYSNTTWRKLRDTFMKEHPICERCLAKGKITPATDVHHMKSPFRNGEVNYSLLLDDKNLMSLCKECHAEIHNKEQGHVSPEDVLQQLDDLFNNSIKDEDIQ